jgi:NADP-dependent 3-hydroxy acid dehydrogenase YdfG
LDALVNNAGIEGNDISFDSDDGILYTVKSNLLGYLYCTRRAIKLMKKENAGHIVNIGSINAETMEEGGEIYTATKSAIRAFSKSLRKSLQDAGIKVSLIEPGMTGTDMLDEDSEEQLEKEKKLEMLKAEDIADAVRYCLTCSPRAVVTSMQVEPLRAED